MSKYILNAERIKVNTFDKRKLHRAIDQKFIISPKGTSFAGKSRLTCDQIEKALERSEFYQNK